MRDFNRLKLVASVGLCLVFTATGCGNKPSSVTDTGILKEFRTNVDTFCNSITASDASINSINTNEDGYEQLLLAELDNLDTNFSTFAALDFPADYDYLEPLADEAATYMDTAVSNYHDIFENEYTQSDLELKSDYAMENYNRAYKRIQIIITFLNGEISDEVVTTEN